MQTHIHIYTPASMYTHTQAEAITDRHDVKVRSMDTYTSTYIHTCTHTHIHTQAEAITDRHDVKVRSMNIDFKKQKDELAKMRQENEALKVKLESSHRKEHRCAECVRISAVCK